MLDLILSLLLIFEIDIEFGIEFEFSIFAPSHGVLDSESSSE